MSPILQPYIHLFSRHNVRDCRNPTHVCDMTHLYVWHDLFISVTWLTYFPATICTYFPATICTYFPATICTMTDKWGVLRDSCMNVTRLTCFPATICAIAVTQLATTRGSVSNLSSISLHMSCHMYDVRRSSVKQSWLSSWLVYIHIARLVCTCHVAYMIWEGVLWSSHVSVRDSCISTYTQFVTRVYPHSSISLHMSHIWYEKEFCEAVMTQFVTRVYPHTLSCHTPTYHRHQIACEIWEKDYMKESCRTYEGVMAHIRRNCVAANDESCVSATDCNRL